MIPGFGAALALSSGHRHRVARRLFAIWAVQQEVEIRPLCIHRRSAASTLEHYIDDAPTELRTRRRSVGSLRT